jgi:hypothetical protein
MKNIKPKCLSGEMILSGDLMKYHDEAGEVELALQEMLRRLKTMHKASEKIKLPAQITFTHSRR